MKASASSLQGGAISPAGLTSPHARHVSAELGAPEVVTAAVEPYLAQRGARLFHSRDCRWATRVEASDRLGFDSKDRNERGFTSWSQEQR